jgi:hypothetical protein
MKSEDLENKVKSVRGRKAKNVEKIEEPQQV